MRSVPDPETKTAASPASATTISGGLDVGPRAHEFAACAALILLGLLLILTGCGGGAHHTDEGSRALFVNCVEEYWPDDSDEETYEQLRQCYQDAALTVRMDLGDDREVRRWLIAAKPCHDLMVSRQHLADCIPYPLP